MLRSPSFSLWALALFTATAVQAKLVQFEAEITRDFRAPDGGKSRPMLLVNGQSPGPPLILDQGDDVEFIVKNSLPHRFSAVHFHGIAQLGSPWSDGTPGLSQKPIPPGGSFTYRWTADTYGTYLYHGHSRGEISDGLYGPILVRPSYREEQPFSLITNDAASLSAIRRAVANPSFVTVSDWTGYTYREWLAAEAASNLEIACTNSILVNGKGAISCPGEDVLASLESPQLRGALNGTSLSDQGCFPPLPALTGDFPTNVSALPPGIIYGCSATEGSQEVFTVDSEQQWVSMNFISATTIQAPMISIDEHDMWVYEVDGHYVEPTKVNGLQIFNGERYSVLVPLDKKSGEYTMRVANANLNQIISGFATLRYGGTIDPMSKSTPYFNYAGANLTSDVVVLNPAQLRPFPASKPAQSADALHVLNLNREGSPHLWTLSGEQRYSTGLDVDNPLLFSPESKAAHNDKLVIRTINGTWVDLVFQVATSPAAPIQPPHPIHKHSNKAYIIGTGNGAFTWSSVADAIKAAPQFFNLETPLLRDTFVTPPAIGPQPVWVVVRYLSMNPGAWFLHCHIQTHFSGGMAMAILDGVNTWPDIPSEYLDANTGS